MYPTDNTNIITNLQLNPSDPSIDKIVNSKGRTLLMETVISGNMEGVRNLLQMGCNPNLTDWRGENSMILAIKKNFNEILGVILDSALHAIDLNCRFFTSKLTYLMMAARLGLSDIIKTLLAAKADPNITDEVDYLKIRAFKGEKERSSIFADKNMCCLQIEQQNGYILQHNEERLREHL